MRIRQSQSGQTLIEVIIAVGLLALVLTTLVSGVALSVRNNRHARNQALSKEHVREALEGVRGIRDQVGWESFIAMLRADGGSTSTPVVYCLPTVPSVAYSTPPASSDFAALTTSANCTTSLIPSTIFSRSITMNLNNLGGPNVTSVRMIVTVSWEDSGRTFSSTSTLVLRQWQ